MTTPKYCRVLIEAEVEIIDPVAYSAALLDSSNTETGDLVIQSEHPVDLPDMPGTAQQYEVGGLLQRALYASPDLAATGIKLGSSSVLVRARRDGRYEAVNLIEMPHRNDDGSIPSEWTPSAE